MFTIVMKSGDLVRNKATGDLAIVASRGPGALGMWMTLIPLKNSALGREIVYLVEYFEVVSEVDDENRR
tara:strand:- start:412 stop:618 length:207 start_codon:yes stop_codon:yes gene_type:complete